MCKGEVPPPFIEKKLSFRISSRIRICLWKSLLDMKFFREIRITSSSRKKIGAAGALTLKGPNAAYAVCHGKPPVLHMKHPDGRQRFTDFEIK